MYKFIGKNGKMYEIENIKQNANCPDSEKSGTGPGSCGGSKEGEDSKEEVTTKPEKKGFLSKLFGGGEKSSIKSISWKQARELSTEDLTKSLEEHVEIAKNGNDADKKAALKNIENINQVLGMRGSSGGYRGNYKTTRKY